MPPKDEMDRTVLYNAIHYRPESPPPVDTLSDTFAKPHYLVERVRIDPTYNDTEIVSPMPVRKERLISNRVEEDTSSSMGSLPELEGPYDTRGSTAVVAVVVPVVQPPLAVQKGEPEKHPERVVQVSVFHPPLVTGESLEKEDDSDGENTAAVGSDVPTKKKSGKITYASATSATVQETASITLPDYSSVSVRRGIYPMERYSLAKELAGRREVYPPGLRQKRQDLLARAMDEAEVSGEGGKMEGDFLILEAERDPLLEDDPDEQQTEPSPAQDQTQEPKEEFDQYGRMN
jgi:hypothetical protein